MNLDLLNLFVNVLHISTIGYGSLRILGELLLNYLPLAILLTFLITGGLYYFRIPPPNKEIVEAILGKDLIDIDTNHGDYVVKTVAHRGAGLDAPENTLAAFTMCKDKGCDFIEFDTCLTADGVPIVFHDHSTERMSDSNFIINKEKWDSIKDLNISSKHPFKDRYPQTNIPTLEQTVNQLLGAGQRMFIDIKDNDTKMVNVILDLFEKYPQLEKNAVVTSFYPHLIYLIRRKNPRIIGSMAWKPQPFNTYEVNNITNIWYKYYSYKFTKSILDWLFPRITYYFIGLSVVLLHKDFLGPKTVSDWRRKGLRVMGWTINSPIEKQYVAKILKITYLTDTFTGENSTHSV